MNSEAQQAVKFLLRSQAHYFPFYERLGYTAYGDEYLDCNIPHRFMSKDNRQPISAKQSHAS